MADIDLKFFKMHPLLKTHNLCYSNGVAILSGFTDVINKVKVLGQLQGQGPKPEKAQLMTLKNMYVQYDCHRPSTFRDLLRKRSARQNV